MSASDAETEVVAHVFARPSEEELRAAIIAFLGEADPGTDWANRSIMMVEGHEWTPARVQIVAEAHDQLSLEGKTIQQVAAFLEAGGLPPQKAGYFADLAADMQRQMGASSAAAPVKSDPIRWPEMLLWLFLIGVVIKSCTS